MSLGWRGYWVASPTPFTVDGALDFVAMKELVEMYISQGIHGLVINGSTGEWCSQTYEERKALANAVVDQVEGRIPIVVGVSSYTAHDVIELARHAKAVKASGVMITPPPYYNLTENEIYNFYRVIETQVEIPIMVYNWPRGIGGDMSEDLLVRLGKLEQVVAIKESSGDEEKTIRVLRRLLEENVDVKFFARFIHPKGSEYLQAIGGDGNIDGGGLGAQYAVNFYNAWWKQELDVMSMNSVAYADFVSQLMNPDYSGKFGSPISQIKACMRILGQPGGYVRPPLLDIFDNGILQQMAEILKSSAIRPAENLVQEH